MRLLRNLSSITWLALIGLIAGGVLLFCHGIDHSLALALLIVSPLLPWLDRVIRGAVTTPRRRRRNPKTLHNSKAEYYLSHFRR